MAVIRGSAVRVVVVALILFGQTSAAQASPGARHVGSIADLLQQAEAGNAQAQYELGIHYYDGAGIPKDSAKALKWFRKAADQDHALAQLALGRFYREGGLGLEKNPQEAVAWFRKAAEQGDAWGQSELALMFELGEGGLRTAPKRSDGTRVRLTKLCLLRNLIWLTCMQMAKAFLPMQNER